MKHISHRNQSDLVGILATLVTGLDEDEDDQTILNYLDLVGRQALLDDESSPHEVYVIVRIGDEEDGDRCGKWIRQGTVTARNEIQAMSLAEQARIGSSRDGMFAVRAAHWPNQVHASDPIEDPAEPTIRADEVAEPDDDVLIALTLLVVNPGVQAYLEKHDPALLKQARNAMYVGTGLLPIDEKDIAEGGDPE